MVKVLDPELANKFQLLLDNTYRDVTTRDRARHSGSWMVPRSYTVVDVHRNENSKLWRKYAIRKAEIRQETEHCETNPEFEVTWDGVRAPYRRFADVETSKVWEALSGSEDLELSVNEWYLFHGTSASAAKNICSTDFKMRLAGTSTGTLYGNGSYFAESVTKADEYAKAESGTELYTLLLCRVLGGRVRYCDEREPDSQKLTKSCIEGPYDCVVGDRRKISGTYREFIIFDAENVQRRLCCCRETRNSTGYLSAHSAFVYGKLICSAACGVHKLNFLCSPLKHRHDNL